MAFKPLDARQMISRDILQQIFPYLPGQQLDALLRSINSDLSAPLRADASSTPNRVVTIGPAIVSNAVSGRQKTIPHIQGVIPAFTSGTVTFPAANAGTIIVSPGINLTLNLPVNNYAKALLSLNNIGNIVVIVGVPDPVEASALVPPPNDNTLPFAYVTLFNNAGTVQNIQQNKIYQFDRSFPQRPSSGGSGGAGWLAGSLPINLGSNSVSYTFLTPQPDTSYIVLPTLENTIDVSPENPQVIAISKSTTGFSVLLSDVTDTSNYRLNYIIPLKAFQAAQVSVSSAQSSVSSAFGIPDNGSNYGLISFLQNFVDGSPQLQPTMVTNKTSTAFTSSWSAPTDSANYSLVYFKMATAIVSIGSGASSVSINVPVGYSNTNYSIVAVMENTVDAVPQFQPLLITAKTGNGFTVSWQDPTDSINYKLVYYAISYA